MLIFKYLPKNKIIMTAIILLLSQSAWAGEFTSETVFNPHLNITKTTGKIDIDGNLNDPGWKNAAVIKNFIERSPGENTAPLVNTEVMITYDDGNLYVAFKCYDDPSTIRATMCQRDQFGIDDKVVILLDTYGNADWAYEFFVNPYGIQKDLLWSTVQGEDAGFDLIWYSDATITSEGYQAEIAIPFSSLRFPNMEIQNWKMDFWRTHPRESYRQYSWCANNLNESCWPCQWGAVDGIKNVYPGKGIELISSAIANQIGVREFAETGNSFNNADPDGEMSIGGKYTLGSDITVEAAYNPDYSQIEADARQIDVNSTFALFYPERRPFFQEGGDIFRTMFNSIYSRMINDPEIAVKVTGRPGKFRFGILSAIDETSYYIMPFDERSAEVNTGKSYINIFRGSQSIGRNSRVGFLINDRRYKDDGSNTVLSFDADLALSSKFGYSIQGIYTHTKEQTDADSSLTYALIDDNPWVSPTDSFDVNSKSTAFDGESFSGNAVITTLHYNSRNLYSQIQYNYIEPTYRTQTGFDPVNNHRTASTYSQYNFYFTEGLFTRMAPSFNMLTRWDYTNGRKEIENINLGYYTQLRFAQTGINFQAEISSEVFDNVEHNNMKSYSINMNNQFNDMIGSYFSIDIGEDIARTPNRKADQLYFEGGLNLKPIDRLFIEPDFVFVKGDDKELDVEWYRQFISRTKISLQFNKKLSLRLIAQYVHSKFLEPLGENEYGLYESKSLNVDPLITFRLNPYTLFYLGSTSSYRNQLIDYSPINYYVKRDFDLNQRQFFVKLQYLFQI
ncbi:MAG: carbohydrate binding family 9 domain-containing protein [bacterium]